MYFKEFCNEYLENLQKTVEFQLILILMKDYGLEDYEKMKQVWGLYVAASFYI